MFAGVLFDLDGTLLDHESAAAGAVAAACGLSADDAEKCDYNR